MCVYIYVTTHYKFYHSVSKFTVLDIVLRIVPRSELL